MGVGDKSEVNIGTRFEEQIEPVRCKPKNLLYKEFYLVQK